MMQAERVERLWYVLHLPLRQAEKQDADAVGASPNHGDAAPLEHDRIGLRVVRGLPHRDADRDRRSG